MIYKQIYSCVRPPFSPAAMANVSFYSILLSQLRFSHNTLSPHNFQKNCSSLSFISSSGLTRRCVVLDSFSHSCPIDILKREGWWTGAALSYFRSMSFSFVGDLFSNPSPLLHLRIVPHALLSCFLTVFLPRLLPTGLLWELTCVPRELSSPPLSFISPSSENNNTLHSLLCSISAHFRFVLWPIVFHARLCLCQSCQFFSFWYVSWPWLI